MTLTHSALSTAAPDDVTSSDRARWGALGGIVFVVVSVVANFIPGFTCTVAVDDLARVREAVIAHGGTITYDEIEIPTVGTLTQFLDTEGNELAAMVYDRPMFGA